MHSMIRARFALVLMAVFGWAASAQAQSANYAIASGYQFLRNEGENLTRGGFGEFAFHIEGPLSLVGQVGVSNGSISVEEFVSGIRVSADGSMTISSYLAGIRFEGRRDSKVAPFFDLLAGYVHGSATATGTATAVGRTVTHSESVSSTELGLQVGGGVNVFVTNKVGLQVSAAYLGIIFEEDISNAFRVATGVVFRF
jgi:hypothetical protein